MFLVNFQKLNKIAFVKILKKFDKLHGTDLRPRFARQFADNGVFADEAPQVYAGKAERMLTNIFERVACAGDVSHRMSAVGKLNARDLAMRYIRGETNGEDEFVFFRVGLWLGAALVMMIFSLVAVFRSDAPFKRDPEHGIVLYIYGGMLIIVLSFFGFSWDLYLWRRYRINHVFIFELDTRHALNYKQFTEFSTVSFFLWTLSFYLFVHDVSGAFFKGSYLPLVLIAAYTALLFLPLPVLHWPSRKWFIKTLWCVFTPGFRKVTFKDFFVADLFISLTFFWTSLYMIACLYLSGDGVLCSPRRSWFAPALICVPLFVRFVQCCRKYVDGRLLPDVFNAVKYVSAMIATFASSWAVINGRLVTLIVWIACATLSALYSYYWDLVKDWNISHSQRIIPRKSFKVAAVVNLVLRFNWVLTISSFLIFDRLLLSFFLGCLEVVRRYVWSLFRIEVEHFGNVEHFRAVEDIPFLD